MQLFSFTIIFEKRFPFNNSLGIEGKMMKGMLQKK